MVFIASYWTEESTNEVRVFSNCEEVELSLNGVVISRHLPDADHLSNNLAHPPFTFQLNAFTPGTLEPKGIIADKVVSIHKVSTPDAPTTLDIQLYESDKKPEAGNKDIIFVYIKKLDNNGTIVPVSGGRVKIDIIGDAQVVNPDPIEFEAGIATVVVQIGEQKGQIKLVAKSEGLDSKTIQFVAH